jgi:hypothetical protein
VISTKPGLHRFLRTTPGGLLRIDTAAVTADARLDGKYMKQVLDLRPVFHRLDGPDRRDPRRDDLDPRCTSHPRPTAELLLTILLGTLRPELAAPTSPDRSPSAD